MRTPADIPESVRLVQRQVSNPSVSAWVAANAGSGKTHVLVQRVINLLLEGVPPEKILCITFTKAAAANMAKRVFDTLGAWATLDDDALDAAVADRTGAMPHPARRALARRLFARALETPGGLKVQTIHAFCTQLLHRFPFEANVAARFNVLDETEQNQLLEQLTLDVLLDGAAAPDGALGRALAVAMVAAADQTFREVVRDAIGRHDAINAFIKQAGGFDAALADLAKALGVDPAMTIADIEAKLVDGPILPSSDWTAVAALCQAGSMRDQEQAARLVAAARVGGSERTNAYLSVFFDSKAQPRANLLTQPLGKKFPDLAQRLSAEQARLVPLRDLRNALVCRERSTALFTVVDAVLTRYRATKERRGLLDYDDLIDKALALLTDFDAAWVHYKLDLGVDHLLIDEAQDTSKKQWQIVQRLVAEFTAGAGARDAPRTIFAVGDEKQSIFSFQDAAPGEFALMRRHFERAHRHAELEFVTRELKHSFRSGKNVLAAVDEVFKGDVMTASVTSAAAGLPPHIALADAPASMVEIWEPEQPDERYEIEGWDAPFDHASETRPRVKLARRIARAVRGLVDGQTPVGMKRDAARYGDILILVRQRGELFEAVIRALKNQNVEVAGADRLMLTEHIAVMDLMALADALLLPQDDLALATALRSPLFGFTDDELFRIAHDRRGALRVALGAKAGDNAKFADAQARLDDLADAARRDPPFGFFAHILGAGGARRQFLARLGVEANDALDEFLNLALDYERRETPSLQGFLAWLREARAEVKRDMEIARDEVRVMTVHGAKGLEAPIVILADTMTPPAGPRPPRLLTLPGGAMIWAGRKDDDAPCVAAAREAARSEAENEYRRLLYVAMTRAADRLIIGGADGRIKRPDGCWYDLIRGALEPFLVEDETADGKVLRFRTGDPDAVAQLDLFASRPPKPPRSALPHWLREPASPQARLPAPLSPSAAFDDDIGHLVHGFDGRGGSAIDRQQALRRGRLVHRLMQSLPDIAAARRGEAAARYLGNAAADLPDAERAAIAARVLTIIADARFAEIFAPGSRAEVPIVGRLDHSGKEIRIAGQVDRLVVTDDAVLIADYKSDRTPPRELNTDSPYVEQLALYRAALIRLYPDKAVRAALLFTAGPDWREVPAAIMEAALQGALARASRHSDRAGGKIP